MYSLMAVSISPKASSGIIINGFLKNDIHAAACFNVSGRSLSLH